MDHRWPGGDRATATGRRRLGDLKPHARLSAWGGGSKPETAQKSFPAYSHRESREKAGPRGWACREYRTRLGPRQRSDVRREERLDVGLPGLIRISGRRSRQEETNGIGVDLLLLRVRLSKVINRSRFHLDVSIAGCAVWSSLRHRTTVQEAGRGPRISFEVA